MPAEGKLIHNTSEHKMIWDETLGHLRSEIDPQIFSAFLQDVSYNNYCPNKNEVLINTPSSFVKKHIENRYASKISTFFSKSLKDDSISLRYEVNESKEEKPAYVVVKKVKANEVINKTPSKYVPSLNKKYTFSNLISGFHNELTVKIAKKIVSDPITPSPLFIYANAGLGKTHILNAIGNMALKEDPSLNICYTSSENFTNELINALRCGEINNFKSKYRSLDLLLIDDIQFLVNKDRTQEEFFHTFNALYDKGAKIVITSDRLPKEIFGLEEKLKTRLSWGISTKINIPDYSSRVEILNKKARDMSIDLPVNVLDLIAKNITANVRELEGALNRLFAVLSLRNEKVNVKVAEDALRDLIKPRNVNVGLGDIKKAVANHFKLKVSDLTSKRRTKNIVFPRHIAVYLCRKHTSASYPEIGSAFGGRDHSSVIHSTNVISEKKDDVDVSEYIKNIEQSLFAL